ncbi:hypothetical protein WN55_03109 [Dufourea novaeangliae]|uniref:Uncharacterized protein n=1 Tax=Dufourea novaeangliae TaxID=178035 RepID=A0A154PJI5_DUFNO|nr:hypothetical protein WN55_03109 [Dufourea novaeangliae]
MRATISLDEDNVNFEQQLAQKRRGKIIPVSAATLIFSSKVKGQSESGNVSKDIPRLSSALNRAICRKAERFRVRFVRCCGVPRAFWQRDASGKPERYAEWKSLRLTFRPITPSLINYAAIRLHPVGNVVPGTRPIFARLTVKSSSWIIAGVKHARGKGCRHYNRSSNVVKSEFFVALGDSRRERVIELETSTFYQPERRTGFYGIITANGLPSGSVTITGSDDKKASGGFAKRDIGPVADADLLVESCTAREAGADKRATKNTLSSHELFNPSPTAGEVSPLTLISASLHRLADIKTQKHDPAND